MDVDIVKFKATEATREDWEKFHIYRRLRAAEVNPDDPIFPDEIVEQAIIQEEQSPEFESHRYGIMKNGRYGELIGTFNMGVVKEGSPSYEGNKHLAQFSISLLPEYRRKGIGTKALLVIHKFVTDREKNVLISGSDEESGKGFLKAIGAKNALAGLENRLYLDKIDWDMVSEWNDLGSKRSPDSKFVLFSTVPENLIEEYSKLYTETMNQQPFGDLEINDLIIGPKQIRKGEEDLTKLGGVKIIALTIEADGSHSGMSELTFLPSKDTFASQGLTVVREQYRGRGLGKWTKAAALLKLRKDHPSVKIVVTGNATTNSPMLSINERLGFVKYKETVSGQITTEQLGEYLSDHKEKIEVPGL